jgi:hypothetical protein
VRRRFAALALALAAGSAAPVMAETPTGRGLSLIVSMGLAPFPVAAEARDHLGRPFWHGLDERSGERHRVLLGGKAYPESRHFRDDSVLLHAAAGFDPARPFRLVLFFHGHGATLRGTVIGEYDLPGQFDRAGANAVLIAPQSAFDAPDSAPGKFVRSGHAAEFLDEAERLARRAFGGDAAAWRRAPVILASFSGGYRTVAQIATHGGIEDRIEGLVLLDSVYADVGHFASWLGRRHHRTFFYALFTPSSAPTTEALKAALRERNIAHETSDDGGAMRGVRIVEIPTEHVRVPVLGPPAEPLGAVLRRLLP